MNFGKKPARHAINYARRLKSLISDPRMPWRVVAARRRKPVILEKIEGPVPVSFSIDLEQDFGSQGNKNVSLKGLERFFRLFDKFTNKFKGDLFVQGSLIENFSDEIKSFLSKGFDLGLHGLHHELWGLPQWFIKDQFVPINEREKRLNLVLTSCAKKNLPRPLSFRAPNLIIDQKSLALIKKYEFIIDSSSSSYLGTDPIITKDNNLYRLPVSVDPQPIIKSHYCFPFIHYRVFNFFNLINEKKEDIKKMLTQIISLQISHHQPPHLVFLLHPWELCDETACEQLSAKLEYLEQEFNVLYTPLKNIVKAYETIGHARTAAVSK